MKTKTTPSPDVARVLWLLDQQSSGLADEVSWHVLCLLWFSGARAACEDIEA